MVQLVYVVLHAWHVPRMGRHQFDTTPRCHFNSSSTFCLIVASCVSTCIKEHNDDDDDDESMKTVHGGGSSFVFNPCMARLDNHANLSSSMNFCSHTTMRMYKQTFELIVLCPISENSQ